MAEKPIVREVNDAGNSVLLIGDIVWQIKNATISVYRLVFESADFLKPICSVYDENTATRLISYNNVVVREIKSGDDIFKVVVIASQEAVIVYDVATACRITTLDHLRTSDFQKIHLNQSNLEEIYLTQYLYSNGTYFYSVRLFSQDLVRSIPAELLIQKD